MNLADNAEGRQDQNVNLRVAEEPEKVLPENGTAAAADMDGRAIYNQTRGQEETGGGETIHQLHDDGRFQWRKGEEQKKSGDELAPDEEGQPHPG